MDTIDKCERARSDFTARVQVGERVLRADLSGYRYIGFFDRYELDLDGAFEWIEEIRGFVSLEEARSWAIARVEIAAIRQIAKSEFSDYGRSERGSEGLPDEAGRLGNPLDKGRAGSPPNSAFRYHVVTDCGGSPFNRARLTAFVYAVDPAQPDVLGGVRATCKGIEEELNSLLGDLAAEEAPS